VSVGARGAGLAGELSRLRVVHLPTCLPLLPPEIFEPVRGEFGVTDLVLNVVVSKIGLQRPRVVAGIRQGEAAGVTQHVRVRLSRASI
jgi:hypothetical protein